MKIKDFVEQYNDMMDEVRPRFIKNNIKITEYIPFEKKIALADNIVDTTTYERETYKDENGDIKRRKTGRIMRDSVAQYFLYIRTVIENYTDLEVSGDFINDYNLLKSSGLLTLLIVYIDDDHPSLIPIDELQELKTLIEMKQNDAVMNYSSPQNYFSTQLEKASVILGTVLKPAIDSLADMDEEKLQKFTNTLIKKLKK